MAPNPQVIEIAETLDAELSPSRVRGSLHGIPILLKDNLNIRDRMATMGYVFELPVNISFFGAAWSEPTLIRIAHAFKQATQMRRPLRYLPTVEP